MGSAFSELLDQGSDGSDGSDGKEQAEQHVSSADNAIIDLIITYLTWGVISVDNIRRPSTESSFFDG